MEHGDLRGAFNLASPNPVAMKQFVRELGQTLGRPAWTRVPAFAIRLIAGRMADETVLVSQKIVPKRLEQAGFAFRDLELRTALKAILQGETS